MDLRISEVEALSSEFLSLHTLGWMYPRPGVLSVGGMYLILTFLVTTWLNFIKTQKKLSVSTLAGPCPRPGGAYAYSPFDSPPDEVTSTTSSYS